MSYFCAGCGWHPCRCCYTQNQPFAMRRVVKLCPVHLMTDEPCTRACAKARKAFVESAHEIEWFFQYGEQEQTA